MMCPTVILQWQHPGLAPFYMQQPMRAGSMSQGLYPQEASRGLGAAAGSGDQGGGNNNGLTEAGSIKPCDAIRTEHIITCEELELNQPIGIGAEGKVGVHVVLCRGVGWWCLCCDCLRSVARAGRPLDCAPLRHAALCLALCSATLRCTVASGATLTLLPRSTWLSRTGSRLR